MQIMEELLNGEKEEFQHMGKSAKFECVFCITLFTRKDSILRHMREVNGILQPHQCIACSKRFANNQTLGRHRRSVCRRNRQTKETGTYNESAKLSAQVPSKCLKCPSALSAEVP